MKYTRYDLKANKKKNEWKTMPILIVIVCVLAIVIGTLIFKLVFPKNGIEKGLGAKNSIADNNKTTSGGNNNSGDSNGNGALPIAKENKEIKSNEEANKTGEEYLTVQFGYYSSKDNADKVKGELGNKAMVIKDGEKYRVIGYIGKEEEANKYIEGVKSTGIESSKGRFLIPKDEECDKNIVEIINGFLDIINKAKDDEVKSIKTNEFKEWSKKIEVKEGSKNVETLKLLKTEIDKLPESISKDNTEKYYQIIFDILGAFK